jgi:hypothetical protein
MILIGVSGSRILCVDAVVTDGRGRLKTGLTVEPGRLVGQIERPGLAGDVFDIQGYAATVTGGRCAQATTPPTRAGAIPRKWPFSQRTLIRKG